MLLHIGIFYWEKQIIIEKCKNTLNINNRICGCSDWTKYRNNHEMNKKWSNKRCNTVVWTVDFSGQISVQVTDCACPCSLNNLPIVSYVKVLQFRRRDDLWNDCCRKDSSRRPSLECGAACRRRRQYARCARCTPRLGRDPLLISGPAISKAAAVEFGSFSLRL